MPFSEELEENIEKVKEMGEALQTSLERLRNGVVNRRNTESLKLTKDLLDYLFECMRKACKFAEPIAQLYDGEQICLYCGRKNAKNCRIENCPLLKGGHK